MERGDNFSAGPAALPDEVLLQAQQELLNWQQQGSSVMEISHRTEAVVNLFAQAEQDFRELMSIPDNYHVLFMHGGARTQFATVPMNLLGKKSKADYVDTGFWSQTAVAEARKYCDVNIAAQGQMKVPACSGWQLSDAAAYVHYTSNETIHGVEFLSQPEVGDRALVCDMSSNILSQVVDVSKYACIYAGAQKNIGPSGMTLVIIRDDMLGQAMKQTPAVFDYAIQAEKKSHYNTPPVFAVYMVSLVLQWLKRQGGVAEIAAVNQRKAEKLYQVIDNSALYVNNIDPSSRSRMNVPFHLIQPELETTFLKQATANGLLHLKGHRELGGMRASLYNAVAEQSVDRLVAFMTDFEKRHG